MLDENAERFIDAAYIAKHLSVAEQTVRSWCFMRKIPYTKVNGCLRFKVSEVENYFAKNSHKEVER